MKASVQINVITNRVPLVHVLVKSPSGGALQSLTTSPAAAAKIGRAMVAAAAAAKRGRKRDHGVVIIAELAT